MTCGIYMIFNSVNGKMYIGQSVKIEERWRSHLRMCARQAKGKLYNAMRKYGADKFCITILEELTNNPALMNAREVYYIAKYASMKRGYNDAEGGYGGRLSKTARNRIAIKSRQQMLSLAAKGKHWAQSKEQREKSRKRLLDMVKKGTHPAQSDKGRKNLSKCNKIAYKEGRNPLVRINAVPRNFVTDDVVVKRIPTAILEAFLAQNPGWRRGRLRERK